MGADKWDGANQIPSIDAIGWGVKSHLQLKRNSFSDCDLPEIARAVLVFRRQTFLLIPTALTAETLFKPFLIHIGELTIVIRGPDGVRQSVGQLQESLLAKLYGLFRPLKADGHDRTAKLCCRFDLHLGPGAASAPDKFTPYFK